MLRSVLPPLLTLLFCLIFLIGDSARAGTADWLVTINTNVIEQCLNYPESKLSPLVRASVHFEQGVLETSDVDKELAKHGAEPDIAIPETLYEYLYSSHLRTVGMRRFKQLVIKPGTVGTIKVTTSNSSFKHEEVNAAVNATVRMYLDLYLNKMPLRSIVVPKDSFDLFIGEMQRHGFRNFTVVPGQFTQNVATLSIRTEPASRQQYMTYGM